jgi:hypothetical protein
VNVFRHDDITQNHEAIPAANTFQHLQEQIAALRIVKKWQPMVATECQEV